jgi:hypothetical protein
VRGRGDKTQSQRGSLIYDAVTDQNQGYAKCGCVGKSIISQRMPFCNFLELLNI